MVQDRLGVLEAYTAAFRDLVNARVRVKQDNDSARHVLELSKDEDWGFLCTAMDVVEDASAAIRNFLTFGFGGPTKLRDAGEVYLRLYGVLSATYIQQGAVLKLYELADLPNPRGTGKLLAALDIRALRNKLGAHSTDHMNRSANTLEAFVPVRIELRDLNCTYLNNVTGKSHTVDLGKAVEAHCEALIGLMDQVYSKEMTTLFRGESSKLAKFEEKLVDLRVQKDGGSVLRFQDAAGKEIVIHLIALEEGEALE